MRKWFVKKLHGFPDIDSAIQHIKDTKDSEKKADVLKEAVKKLYNAVSADDILAPNKEGTWNFQGKPLTQTEVEELRNEAREMLGMKIWRVIKLDLRYQLGKKMFEEAKCLEDMLWGQLLLYLDDVIRNRLQKMK